MPRNGTGTWSPPGSTWNPPVNGVTATATDWATLLADIATGLTQSISKDGQTTPTGNLPMGNNKITGLAPGTAQTDAVSFSQLGNFSGYTTTATNLTLTVANIGEYIKITAASVTITLPAGSALAAGSTFTFGTTTKFTIVRAGSDTISGPSGTGLTTLAMYGPCSVVWRGDVYEVVMGGDAFVTTAPASYLALPGGLVTQMGTSVQTLNGGGGGSVTFPVAFLNACFTVIVCNGDNAATALHPNVNGFNTTSFGFVFPAAGAISTRTNWVAFGN